MELHNRKPNRLPEFDYGQEGCYFVTICTHNRTRLFQIERPGTAHRPFPTEVGNQIIHKWVLETERKFPNIMIEKYVIMEDHLHIIVTIEEQHAGCSLSDIMRFFKTMTTNDYIKGVKAGIFLYLTKNYGKNPITTT